MQVFVSWSGPRSRAIAEALRTWLPRVIQSVRPWMSQEDISAGSRWLSEVSSLLDSSQVGILCVTPENQHNPWLLFEAGALSKSLELGRVCPVLFDITAGQLSGPLTQFQAQHLDKAGVLRILTALNGLTDAKLPEGELLEILEVWWPHLEMQLNAIGPVQAPQETRSTQEQLDELLSLAREQIRRENVRLESNKVRDEKMEQLFGLMDQSISVISGGENRAKKFQAALSQIVPLIEKLSDGDPNHVLELDAAMKSMLSGMQMPPVIDMAPMKRAREQMIEMYEEQKRLASELIAPVSNLTGDSGTKPPDGD